MGVGISLSTRDVVGEIDSKALLRTDFSTFTLSNVSGGWFLSWRVARSDRLDRFSCAEVVPFALLFCADLICIFVSSSDDSVAIEARAARCRFGVGVTGVYNAVVPRVARRTGDSVDESVLFRFIVCRWCNELCLQRGSGKSLEQQHLLLRQLNSGKANNGAR